MSLTLMAEAFSAPIPTLPKFVLVALCDIANDHGECFPSIKTIAARVSATERAVQLALSRLEGQGYVRREFREGRSTVYWISPSGNQACVSERKPQNQIHPHPRTKFTPTPEPNSPRGERGSPPPPNQIHPGGERGSPITIIEPSIEPLPNRNTALARPAENWAWRHCFRPCNTALARPADVSAQVWSDWLQHRKAKRAPVTVTVLAQHRSEAEKAGWVLEDALKEACGRGWVGFKADFVSAKLPWQPVNKQTALEARNSAQAAAWAKKMREAQIEV